MSRLVILIVIAVIVPAVSAWVVREFPGVQNLELLAYDWHSRALPTLPADDRIALIGMDDESLEHLPLERPAYPLPRTMHAQVVEQLHSAGAKIVAFDVMFTRDIPNEDVVFARALKEHGRVFCGIQPDVELGDGGETVTFTKTAHLLRPHITACSILVPRLFGRVRWYFPWITDANTTERHLHLTMALAAAHLDVQEPARLSFERISNSDPLGLQSSATVRSLFASQDPLKPLNQFRTMKSLMEAGGRRVAKSSFAERSC